MPMVFLKGGPGEAHDVAAGPGAAVAGPAQAPALAFDRAADGIEEVLGRFGRASPQLPSRGRVAAAMYFVGASSKMRPSFMHKARASSGSGSLRSKAASSADTRRPPIAGPRRSSRQWAGLRVRHVPGPIAPSCLFCRWGATWPSGGPRAAQSVPFSWASHFQSVSPAAAASAGTRNLPRSAPVAASRIQSVPPSAKTTSPPVASFARLWTT